MPNGCQAYAIVASGVYSGSTNTFYVPKLKPGPGGVTPGTEHFLALPVDNTVCDNVDGDPCEINGSPCLCFPYISAVSVTSGFNIQGPGQQICNIYVPSQLSRAIIWANVTGSPTGTLTVTTMGVCMATGVNTGGYQCFTGYFDICQCGVGAPIQNVFNLATE